ncbi:TetR family transcriptional regulator [Streptomyces olivaceus]|uniref:TetR/AcrR family transcriptional regulator n=1 Tax=Streptomyces olivaceus TaxID=47716 RepID=UPI001CCCD2F4|nr:TetR family transcriptional regulator [Streptomyces olivaceus]MBZ6142430.1 TetR family transcriptional regulator [Streptomyces olivaceus]MBZ6170082.1 TetR family transcriptional regulator [Streptomyces olivaceus]MBZ6260437.1 TetR family transcriptional regulator [Streptomyces olivaceus]
MYRKPPSGPVHGRTFTQEARRAQIVEATIETLAEIGHTKTSFTAICRHANLSSTGLISYHFAGKPQLLREVTRTIVEKAGTLRTSRVAQETTYRGKLVAYIAAHFDFMARYPAHARALTEIAELVREQPVPELDDVARSALSVEALVALLEEGCRAGEFRIADPPVLALAVQGALDNVVRHHELFAVADLDHLARELTDIFTRCTLSP